MSFLTTKPPLVSRSSLGPSPLSTPGNEADIEDIIESCSPITDDSEELRVTFHPPLYLQRRIWILDILRQENVTSVLDIGCGEGQLLSVLCQPAPWLAPPPVDVLNSVSISSSASALPTGSDDIINLHTRFIAGLDISTTDLAFAVENIQPPPPPDLSPRADLPAYARRLQTMRWEPLEAQVWAGGLETLNESFVGIECIVSTEVIEHVPEDVLPFYAPMILGVYHPRLFLLTTPSYTFNARFTAPTAPPSVRKGYPDPTGRTERVFRHSDHKFEWTVEEFREWCTGVASEWGYDVEVDTVGRPLEDDPYGRDEELGGATQVATFRRRDTEDSAARETKGRQMIQGLWASRNEASSTHNLLAKTHHSAHPAAEKPSSPEEIANAVKSHMDEYREAFMRLEELWFEPTIAAACGGWIELLIRVIDASETLSLQREGTRAGWTVQLDGGLQNVKLLWPTNSAMESLRINEEMDVDDFPEADQSIELIPVDWTPGEEGSCFDEGESTASDRGWESTAAEGDVSWNGSEAEDDDDDAEEAGWGSGWNARGEVASWGQGLQEEKQGNGSLETGHAKLSRSGSGYSTAGWEGDESEDTS